MTWQAAVGVSVSKDRGDENGVVPHLLATKGGGQKVAGGDDEVSNLFRSMSVRTYTCARD